MRRAVLTVLVLVLACGGRGAWAQDDPLEFYKGYLAVLAKATDLSMAGLKLIGDFGSADDRMTLSIPITGDREVVTQVTVRRRGDEEVRSFRQRVAGQPGGRG